MTIHVGEEGFADEIGEVVEHLRPDRIGHGILAAGDPELGRLLRDAGTVLEICPTSNLLTGALAGRGGGVRVFRTFVEGGVAITVSTDGPEMMRTHLRDEFDFLCRIGALQPDEARAANAHVPHDGTLRRRLVDHEAKGDMSTALRRTPLHARHVELGARMVPFAGWEMPVY